MALPRSNPECFVRRQRVILETINWSVQPGGHWTILGPNDSGKTTLLKLASGYLSPNAGGIVLRKGKELTYLPELRKKHRLVDGIVASEIPSQEKALNRGIREICANRLPRRILGTSEQQKVLIARARMTKPRSFSPILRRNGSRRARTF